MQPNPTLAQDVKDVLTRIAGDELFRRELIEQVKHDPQVCELLLQETAPDLIRALQMLKTRLPACKGG